MFPGLGDLAERQREAREKVLGVRELRYFLTLAETGNFGRAARDLNVGRAAISLAVRKLEQGLGTQLLRRHGRGVTMTAVGASLRDRLQTVLHLLAAPLDDAAANSVPSGISFAVPMESDALVTPLLSAFRARWPDVKLTVREGGGADLEEWLLCRRVDLALLRDPPALPEIEIRPVLTERLGLVASVHSNWVQEARPLSLRELAGNSLVLPDPSHWIRRRLEIAAQQHGIRLSPNLQVNSTSLIKTIVRGALGYTILPSSSIRDDVARGILAFRAIRQPELTSTCAIAFHRGAPLSLVPNIAEMVRDVVAAQVGGRA
jgi:LysR family nitrogen assimilation transcriptional regulator